MKTRSGAGGRRMRGLAVGLVTNISDPDNLGRVKVRFPWLADDVESNWARVAGWYAGGSRGTMFIPEVGDEVMCAFDHGDPNHPYVMGAVWNGKDTPHEPGNPDGNNDHKWFRSRQGHDLEFLDTSGGEKIRLVDSSQKNSVVLDTAGDTITTEAKSGSITLLAPAGLIQIDCVDFKVTTSKERKLAVGDAHTVTVGVSRTVDVSKGNLHEAAGSSYSMTTASFSASTKAHAGLSAGAATVNAGQMKASVGKALMMEQGSAVTRTVGKQVVNADCFVTVGPDGSPSGVLTLTAGKLDLKSDKGVGLKGKIVTLTGGMVDISASSIVVAKDRNGGKAALSTWMGGMLMLNAGGITMPAAKMLDLIVGLDMHGPIVAPPPVIPPTIPMVPAPFVGPVLLSTQPTVLVNFMPAAGTGATAIGFHIPYLPYMWLPKPYHIIRTAILTLVAGAVQALVAMAVAQLAGLKGAEGAAQNPNGFWSGFLSQPGASAGGDTPLWQRLVPALGSPMSFMSFLAQCMPLPVATGQTTIASPTVLAADAPMALAMPMGGNSCSDIPIVPNASVIGFSNVMVGMSLSQLLGVMAWNVVNAAVNVGVQKGMERGGNAVAQRMARSNSPAVRNNAQRLHQFMGNEGCIAEGHPVDVVSGTMFTEQSDFELYGAQSVKFSRFYNAKAREALPGDASAFGPGWRHAFDEQLLADMDDAEVRSLGLRDREGRLIGFDHPLVDGGEAFQAQERLVLRRRDGRTFEVESLDGTVRTFRFPGGDGTATPPDYLPGIGSKAKLLSVRTPYGGEGLRLRYEGNRLVGFTDPGEREVRFEHDAQGRIVEARLVRSGGRECSVFLAAWRYDPQGRLSAHEDRNRQQRRFVYDPSGRLVRETDRNGHSFHFAYDDADRCVRTYGDDNIYWREFRYEAGASATVVERGDGSVWHYGYDESGRVTAIVAPTGASTRRAYTPEGWLESEIDPLGRTTAYTYDPRGRPTSTTTPKGATTKTLLDPQGRRLALVDPAGQKWPMVTDPDGRLLERRTPSGRAERYAYDTHGRVVRKETSDGRVWTRAWRADGLPERDTRPDGTALEYVYDLLGHVTTYRHVAADGQTRETRLARDDAGRIIRVERPLEVVEHYTLQPEGEVTELRVGRRTTRRTWGGYARLDAHVDPSGRRTVYKHDLDQRIVAVELESGEHWTYRRDLEGRVVEAQRPDGSRVRYERDAAGQCVAEHLPDGRVCRRLFDDDGFVVEEQYGDEPPTRYGWDAAGRLVSIERAGARPVKRAYDADGHLVAEQQGDERLLWDHDASGRTSRRRASWGGAHQVKWGAAGLSALRDAEGREHEVTRDAWGRRAALRLPGRVTRTHTWDELDRIVGDAWVLPGGDTAHARALTWDTDDRIARIETDGRTGRHGEALAYDTGGRLTAWSRDGDRRREYTHGNDDAVAFGEGRTRERGRGGRVATDEQGRSRRYDARGRMRRIEQPHGPARQLWFDGRDRLTRVVTEDARLVLHEYDALGRLARTVAEAPEGPREERFYWDGNLLARRCVGVPGAETPARDEEYVYDPERQTPLWRTVRTGGRAQVQYYGCDQRGAATHLFDAQGELLWEGVYSPYALVGERGTESGEQPLRLAGQVHDLATGLCHHRFRVFDPETATFVSADPLGFPGGQNPWAFPSDPMRLADPLGLAACNETHATRGDAETAARQRAGIPEGQQPDATWTVGNDHTRRGEAGYVFSDDPGTHGNYAQYETPNGSRVIAEHTGDPNAPLPHFHAGQPKGDSNRSLVDFGWGGNPRESERYAAVGGKHHHYYNEGGE